jgi:hypothetical protein
MLEQQKLDLKESFEFYHRLDLVLQDGNISYFAACSAASYYNYQEVCAVNRALLVQSIYSGEKLHFKTMWLDVPSWECRIFALKSTKLKNVLYFYLIGWDGEMLQALAWQVEAT